MTLDDADLAHIWREDVRPYVFALAESSDEPVTVLLGGQPGAGKTRAGARVAQAHSPDVITAIVGDDLRQFHPDYRAVMESEPLRMPEVTAAASGRWIGMCVDHANTEEYSVLIEGTWRSAEVPLQGARLAHEHNRQTHAVVVAVPAAVSRLSAMARYYRDADAELPARWTPPEAHDSTVKILPDVVEQVAASRDVDRFTVTDRSGAVLFDQTGAPGPERGTAAREAFTKAFSRQMTEEEREHVLQAVPELLASHERHTADRPDAQVLAMWARDLQQQALTGEHAANSRPQQSTPRRTTPRPGPEVSRRSYQPGPNVSQGRGPSL